MVRQRSRLRRAIRARCARSRRAVQSFNSAHVRVAVAPSRTNSIYGARSVAAHGVGRCVLQMHTHTLAHALVGSDVWTFSVVQSRRTRLDSSLSCDDDDDGDNAVLR